ncbi:MAG: hypothetical protein ACFE8P_04380, partial [Promethearchaeota archaeon]
DNQKRSHVQVYSTCFQNRTLEENYIQLNEHKIPLVSIYRLNSFLEGLYLNLDYYKQVHINRISVQKRLF